MPLSTSAPSIMNGRSRANSSIGRPPAPPPGGVDAPRPRRDQRTDLFHEVGADARVALIVGESAHKTGQVHANRPHTGDARLEAVRSHLPLMPIDEDRIDGHQTKLAP